jgi:4-aminobutyrate aminotransferase
MKIDPCEKASAELTSALVIHTGITAAKARGMYVSDAGGRRYMDFTAGLATVNTGHNHPRIIKAIMDQSRDLIHAGGIFYHEPLVNLPQRLNKITPLGLDTFFFSNSGIEAVEGALKLIRSYTKRQGIIAFTGAFHGRVLSPNMRTRNPLL